MIHIKTIDIKHFVWNAKALKQMAIQYERFQVMYQRLLDLLARLANKRDHMTCIDIKEGTGKLALWM